MCIRINSIKFGQRSSSNLLTRLFPTVDCSWCHLKTHLFTQFIQTISSLLTEWLLGTPVQLQLLTLLSIPYNNNNLFNGPLSRTTWVSRYRKKHLRTHILWLLYNTTSLINSLHFLQSVASSLHIGRVWQSFSMTSLQVCFRLPLGLTPSTSKSMHFFAQFHPSLNTPIPS